MREGHHHPDTAEYPRLPGPGMWRLGRRCQTPAGGAHPRRVHGGTAVALATATGTAKPPVTGLLPSRSRLVRARRPGSARGPEAAYLFPLLLTGIRAHLQLGRLAPPKTGLTGPARDWQWAIPAPFRRSGTGGTDILAYGDIGAAQQALESARTVAGPAPVWKGMGFWPTWPRRPPGPPPREAAHLADQARTAAGSRPRQHPRRCGAQFLTSLRQGRPVTPGARRATASPKSRGSSPRPTNRQIAEQLAPAPKTVAAHVTAIYQAWRRPMGRDRAWWATIRRKPPAQQIPAKDALLNQNADLHRVKLRGQADLSRNENRRSVR